MAIAFAKEGANVSVVYLEEHEDAKETQRLVEEHGRKCLFIPGDVGKEKFCREPSRKRSTELGRLDILVNNAAEQHPQDSIEDITEKQLERTFRTNVFAYFFLVKAALKHLEKGARSSTRHRLPHTRAAPNCSIIPPPKAPRSRLPAHWRCR